MDEIDKDYLECLQSDLDVDQREALLRLYKSARLGFTAKPVLQFLHARRITPQNAADLRERLEKRGDSYWWLRGLNDTPARIDETLQFTQMLENCAEYFEP